MRLSKIIQIGCAVGVMTTAVEAQLTPAQEQQALEAVRRKVAEMESGTQPLRTSNNPWRAQADQFVRDGRLSQTEYDNLISDIHAFEANRKTAVQKSIEKRLNRAATRKTRDTPAARIVAEDRIGLHQQQRMLEEGNPNAAYARDLERRVREDMKKNPSQYPASAQAPLATTPRPPAPVMTPVPRPAPPPPVARTSPAPAPATAPQSADNDAYARDLERRVREEIRQNPNAFSGSGTTRREPKAAAPVKAATTTPATVPKSAPAPKPAPEKKPEKPAVSKAPAKTDKPALTTAPAPAGPKTKREKLAELLERYKADKLTPTQYQEERAKILAEP